MPRQTEADNISLAYGHPDISNPAMARALHVPRSCFVCDLENNCEDKGVGVE